MRANKIESACQRAGLASRTPTHTIYMCVYPFLRGMQPPVCLSVPLPLSLCVWQLNKTNADKIISWRRTWKKRTRRRDFHPWFTLFCSSDERRAFGEHCCQRFATFLLSECRLRLCLRLVLSVCLFACPGYLASCPAVGENASKGPGGLLLLHLRRNSCRRQGLVTGTGPGGADRTWKTCMPYVVRFVVLGGRIKRTQLWHRRRTPWKRVNRKEKSAGEERIINLEY